MAPNDTNNDKFWMVYIEGESAPTRQHFSLNDARLEAERLLHLPGNGRRKAHILENGMIGMMKRSPVTWRTV